MTDFTESNFNFWSVRDRDSIYVFPLPPYYPSQANGCAELICVPVLDQQEHPSLKPYIESGMLDSAIFDAVKDGEIRLAHSKKARRLLIASFLFIDEGLLVYGLKVFHTTMKQTDMEYSVCLSGHATWMTEVSVEKLNLI